jgi:hypothetical protein
MYLFQNFIDDLAGQRKDQLCPPNLPVQIFHLIDQDAPFYGFPLTWLMMGQRMASPTFPL